MLSENHFVTIGNLDVTYESGRSVAVTKLVQPPAVTVDPPPFVFVADPAYDLTAMQGRLTIMGGDAAEGAGDLLVIHNQNGSSAAAT